MTPEQIRYNEIISKVASELGIPGEDVDRTYKAYWSFIRHSLTSLMLKTELTEEDFNKLRTSVNVPSLGKFSCTYENYIRIRKRLKYINKLKDYEYKES